MRYELRYEGKTIALSHNKAKLAADIVEVEYYRALIAHRSYMLDIYRGGTRQIERVYSVLNGELNKGFDNDFEHECFHAASLEEAQKISRSLTRSDDYSVVRIDKYIGEWDDRRGTISYEPAKQKWQRLI